MNIRHIIPSGLPRGVWVVAVTASVLMSGLGMIVPLLPVYSKQLGATPGELGFLMAGVFIGRLAAQVPAGLVTDRIGRRPVLLSALVGYTLTCIGYALATSPTWLILFRLLQGLSAGFFSVAARSLMNDLSGPRLRGSAQGVYSSSVNLGFVIGPVIGSFGAARYGMSAPFWGSACLSGIALIVLTFISYPTRLPVAAVTKLPARTIIDSISNGRIRLLFGTNLLFMAGLSIIMTLFPVAGKAEIEGGLPFVGIAIASAGISGLLFGPLAGRMSDRFGRSPLLLLGAILAAAEGAALFCTRSPWLIGMGFFLGGIGVASFFNSLHAAVGDLTTKKDRGTVTGIIGIAGETGGIIGSLLAPFIWHCTDLRMPFGMQLVFTGAAVCLILWLWRLRIPKPIHPAEVRDSIITG